MTDQDEVSLGEIARAVKRLETAFAQHQKESRSRFHELANTMNAALAPIGVHTVQIESQQKAIGRLDDDVKAVDGKVAAVDSRLTNVRVQSAWISGGLSAGAAVLEFLFGRHP